jgi:MFS family permease
MDETPAQPPEPGGATHFKRNALSFFLWEVLWGIGAPCCMVQTMVPAYLQYLGASKSLIQTVTAMASMVNLLMLWSGKWIHGAARKRLCFLYWILFCAGWLVYGGLALLAFSAAWRWLWLALFTMMVLSVCAVAALAGPATEEMLLQNIPLARRGFVSALRSFGLGISGLAGIGVAVWLFRLWDTPMNYHARFIIGALLMALSCLMLFLFRDHAAQTAPVERISIRADGRHLIGNVNFRILLVFLGLMVAAQSLAPLILTYGIDHAGMAGRSDYFTAAWFVGSMIFGIIVPPAADRFGFRLLGLANAAILMVAFLCPVLGRGSQAALLTGYALYGASTMLTIFVLPNLGAEMVPEIRPASLIGVGTALCLPLGLVVAPLSGMLVDAWGQAGYIGAFMVGATLCLCSLVGFILIVREPRTGQELYVRLRRV